MGIPKVRTRTEFNVDPRIDTLRAELAAAQLAHSAVAYQLEVAIAERNALRDLIRDLCATRKPTEFGTYEDALIWMRARCVAGGEKP